MKSDPKLPKRFPTGVKDKNGRMICIGDKVRITNAYTDEFDEMEVCFGKTNIMVAGPKEEEPLPYIGIFVKGPNGFEDSLLCYVEGTVEFELEVI